MKKVLAILCALSMVAGLCACGAATTTPSATTTAAPETTAAGETTQAAGDSTGNKFDGFENYSFNLSMHDPATSNNGKFYATWAQAIEEETEGHVHIEIYYSGQLASSKDVSDMVESGGVDLGWVYTGFYPDQFPLTDVTTMPFQGFGNAVPTTETLWDLYDETPELQDEWSAYKLLTLYGNPGLLFASTQTELTSPESVKNQVLRCPSGCMTDLLNQMGGSPTVMGPGDMFDSIQKNVISGFVFEPAGITNFSLQEAAKMTYTNYEMYDTAFALVMNWDKWNSLPVEFQEIIDAHSGREGSIAAAQDFQDTADAAHTTIEEAGNTWVDLTDEQIAAFKAAADPVVASWVEKYSANGFDYAAYLAKAQEILAKYAK